MNETHPERGDAALAQRQRPETPDSPAVPVVPALPPAAAATPPAPPPREAAGAAKGPSTPAEAPGRVSEPASGPGAPSLTAGQEEFLASLGDPGRAAFDALPPEKRAEVLAPHAAGYDRVIGGEQARRLSPPAEVAPPPIPRTTGELIEMLPGAPRSWSQMAAEAMVQDFGAAKDRRLWGQFVLIAEAIRAGDLDAAPVLDAYGQAMRPGIRARGAKFWAAFKGLTGIDGPPFHRRE